MLLANETVAAHLDEHDGANAVRVHEEPDPLKVEEFEEFISTLGYSLGKASSKVSPRDFQKLVERMRNRAGGEADRVPHAANDAEGALRSIESRTLRPRRRQLHAFHVPIRRYPDLVVHRTLRESRRGMTEERKAELLEELPETARHTSERERRADDAERELVQWKKVRFMADKVGDEFDGYVTGVTAFGLYIELVEHFVEGLVHVSTMADDYYRFVERAHMLRGENKGKVYADSAISVKVQVIKVDMERRQVDLGLVEILDAVRESESNRGPAPKRGPAAAGARQAGAREDQAASRKRGAPCASGAERSCVRSLSARPGISITAKAHSSAH